MILPGHVRIMFLGGPLDHAVRQVEHAEGHPDRPSSETYRSLDLTYWLHRVDVGERAWFCYVLEGHTPSRLALLDTNPYPSL